MCNITPSFFCGTSFTVCLTVGLFGSAQHTHVMHQQEQEEGIAIDHVTLITTDADCVCVSAGREAAD